MVIIKVFVRKRWVLIKNKGKKYFTKIVKLVHKR